MSDYPCPSCGASGLEHCSTLTGRDHVGRWHLQDDVAAMLKLIANRDVGFRYRGERTLRHVWTSDSERRPMTSRERLALQALIDGHHVEPVHAVGSFGRGYYERRGGAVGKPTEPHTKEDA